MKPINSLLSALVLLALTTPLQAADAPLVPATTPPNQNEPTPLVLSRNDTTQVTVTEDDLAAVLLQIPTGYRSSMIADSGKLKQLIDNLVLAKNVAFDARQQQFDQLPEVQAQLKWEMEKRLATLYLQHKEKMKRQEMEPQTEVLLKLAQEQYEVLKANGKMKMPEMIRVAHILIKSTQADGTSAQAFAQQLYDKIKAGANFEELAKAHSEDPGSKANGGDLGYFPSNKMVPEFEAVAFTLNADKPLSEPVKTQFGIHIIKFVDRKPAVDKTFEAVKAELIEKTIAKAASESRSQYTTKILSPEIKVYADAIKAYQDKHVPAAPAMPTAKPTNNPQN